MDNDKFKLMHDEFWENLYEKQRLSALLEKVNGRISELSQKMMQCDEEDHHTEENKNSLEK